MAATTLPGSRYRFRIGGPVRIAGLATVYFVPQAHAFLHEASLTARFSRMKDHRREKFLIDEELTAVGTTSYPPACGRV